MPHFEVKQSAKLNPTSYSGLALIGQCCQAAAVLPGGAGGGGDRPEAAGVAGYAQLGPGQVDGGAAEPGQSDFEAIEPFRGDRCSRWPTSGDRWAALGRSFDSLTKWNPRRQNKAAWVNRVEAAGAFKEVRAGKRVGLLDLQIERAWKKAKRTLRLVVRVTERTIDKKGQHLLIPEIELEGWWTSLAEPMSEVIELYKQHGTHEQFHAEIKTDLDLERLPSGKFDTNDAVVHLAAFAYNGLRLIGQLGLTGDISPIRHPAKRRRDPRRCCRRSCTGRRSSSNTAAAWCWTSGAASPRV